jgi:hypothetical protein
MVFHRPPSWIAASGIVYCSPQCRSRRMQRDHPSVERQCAMCGQTFVVPHCRALEARFCSRTCHYRHKVLTPKQPLAERFWTHVERGDGCWLWLGHRASNGYGRFGVWDGTRTDVRQAHRVAWELTYGAIPVGMSVLHNCPGGDVRNCVNPAHLWLGSIAENQADMVAKDRSARGERAHNVKLTAPMVRTIRQRWAAGGITQPQLARQHGVSRTAISAIVTGRTWRHLL